MSATRKDAPTYGWQIVSLELRDRCLCALQMPGSLTGWESRFISGISHADQISWRQRAVAGEILRKVRA